MSGSQHPFEARLRPLLLPAVSLALFVLMTSLLLAAAGKTLGYDFEAYWQAAQRLTAGRSLYDPNVSTAGGFAIYLYPPPFAVALVPLTLLPHDAAMWLWEAFVVLCLPTGALLLPVRWQVRWSIVLLAAVDWPFLYSCKLGQVGPILFLLFAAVWRWLDRAPVVGTAAAIGALIKVQPGVVALWALVTRRYRAVAFALGVGAVVAVVTLPFVGLGSWGTYVDLMRRLGGTLSAAHNFAPGAVAQLAGASQGASTVVQLASMAVAVAALLVAWRYGSPALSLQVTFVASQLLTAPLRDHYAMLLLLPTAWLLDRGRAWAVAFPLAGWLSLGALPDATTAAPVAAGSTTAGSAGGSWLAAATVPLAFFACLAVLLAEIYLERRPGLTATAES